ncbi:AAA family ATPase [Nocardioides baculatus]|uniref:AAA family ATPase n=1 Tax=Nocardioides baculatus TaxID=2801337 RepID=A0ABS1LE42_9ACTN|nr:AAA family ATPase [Nocardioides baculatus]MBL0749966.1 AAA family ATPase [Nocardioides baculatus]
MSMKLSGGPAAEQPVFAIREIEIANVGGIRSSLSVAFHELHTPTLFYGGNGVGKTTLLEAASLLGHVPCLPIQEWNGSVTASLLRRSLGEAGAEATWWGDALPKSGEDARSYMTRFLEEVQPYGYGAIRLEVNNRGLNEFVILVRPTGAQAPTLTAPLSRREGSGEEDDVHLEESFVVVRFDDASGFTRLNEQLFRGRTFFVGNQYVSADSLLERRHIDLSTVTGSRRVSYVNTDLNDFGRGRDLRESPKMLKEDFDKQVRQRFEAPFQGRDYHAKGRLNSYLAMILPGSPGNYSDARAVGDGLQIDTFALDEHGKTDFWATRGDAGGKFRPNFLSAGENEVLFLLLMCLENSSDPDRDVFGVLLLDEPDLHLATASRIRFFRAISDICSPGTQAVLASHSESSMHAFTRPFSGRISQRVRVLYVFRDANGDRQTRAIHDPKYIGALSPVRYRIGGIKRRIERPISPHYGSWLRRSAVSGWSWVMTAVVLAMAGAAGLAVVNDILDVFGVLEFDEVEWIHRRVRTVYLVGGACALVYLVLAVATLIERLVARKSKHEFGTRSWLVGLGFAVLTGSTVRLVWLLGEWLLT